ncbi:MAG: hypothetical protein ABGX83_05275 [Nitrospira sp.]
MPRFDSVVDIPSTPRPKLGSAVQAIPELPVVEKQPTASADDIGRIYDSDPDKPMGAIPDRSAPGTSPIQKQVATPTDIKASAQGKGKLIGWWDGLDPANKKAINRALLTTGLSLLAQSGEVSRYPISTAGQVGKAALKGVAAYDQSLQTSAAQGAASAKQKMAQDKLALEEEKMQLQRQRYQLDVEKLLSDERIVEAENFPGLPERTVPNKYLPGDVPAQGPHVPASADRTLPGLDFQGRDPGIPAPQTREDAAANRALPQKLDTETVTRPAKKKGKNVLAKEKIEADIEATKALASLRKEREKHVGTKAAGKGPSAIDIAWAAKEAGTATESQLQRIKQDKTSFVREYQKVHAPTFRIPKEVENVRRQAAAVYDVERAKKNPVPENVYTSGNKVDSDKILAWFKGLGLDDARARKLATSVFEKLKKDNKK